MGTYPQSGCLGSTFLSIHGHKNANDGGLLDDTAFGYPPGRGWEYYKKIGVTNYEAWYSMPTRNNTLGTVACANGTMYAIPFPVLSPLTLDRISLSITTFVAGGARLGIYADSGMYPAALVLDAGAIVTTANGNISITISQALNEGTLYWLSFIAGAAFTVNGVASADTLPILGYSNVPASQNPFLTVAQAYGALPGTFPGGGAITAGVVPLVFVRRSA